MIQIYKPNKNNTGHACSFQFSQKHDCVYLEILKQVSWDGNNGSFGANRKKPGFCLNVKINKTEIAAILNTLERKVPAKLFHSFDKSTTTVNFGPWMNNEVQQGYSLAISNKEEGVECKFLMGLSMDEGRLLREYLLYALRQLFFLADKAYENSVKAKAAEPAPEPAPTPAPAPVEPEPEPQPEPVDAQPAPQTGDDW